MIREIGAVAGLAAFLGLALLALLAFSQARDIRRLREWAGSAPERDAERKEAASTAAAEKAEEIRRREAMEAERQANELREERRRRRETGLPETTWGERLRERLAAAGATARRPRVLAASALALAMLGGGVAYATLHGFGGEGARGDGRRASRVTPAGQIEVSVLNGTAVPGLAARYGDKVEHEGFNLGAVTNSPSSFVDSVVMFERGSAPEARRVGRALGIPRMRLMTPDIASVSAGSPVSVVIGEDHASASG